MKFPRGSIVPDHVSMGLGECTCKMRDSTSMDWIVSGDCSIHCKRDILHDGENPVQMTVGATYYENAMLDHVPSFMHYQCTCENVGHNSDRNTDMFLVMSNCPMHNPNGGSVLYPVRKTVMK